MSDDIERGGTPPAPDGAAIDAPARGDGAAAGSVEQPGDEGDGGADLPGVTASGAE